jgi:poly-gamma-glutamate synthesis protein (capsule biosynthesis protein)
MAPRQPERARNPWFPFFLLSIAAFVGSLVTLAIVTVNQATGDDGAPDPGIGSSSSPVPASTDVLLGLTYTGDLPPGAETLGLVPAAAGKTPDIEFASTRNPGDLVPVAYLVPAAALGAGVDSLTSEQLSGILRGEITDWATVGGISGKVQNFTVASTDLRPAMEWAAKVGLPLATSNARTVDSYDALRQAMTLDSGGLAFVPPEELRPNMVAIAVDGIDIVRGFGDAANWPLTQHVAVIGHTDKGKAHAAAIREQLAVKLPKITRIVATGDILQSRCSLAAIMATGDWGAALRGPVGEYLASADLALGSLDGSIQGIGTPDLCVPQDYPNLTSPPEVIEALTLAGIDEMTLATNHAFDCGSAGCGSKALLESQSRLNDAGIKTVGGGKDLEDALAPAIFEVNGITFGVLGFDDIAAEDFEATDSEPGTAPLDDSYADEQAAPPAEPAFYKPASMLGVSRLQERIRQLKTQVDVVIVQIQSGTEDTHAPSPRSIKGLRAAADAGADLIVGNQAHWVQAVEVRDDRFIAYALGNFIFDQVHTPEHTQGYLLEATFLGKQLATVRFVPYQIEDRYKPTFVEPALRTKILTDVMDASLDLPSP